MLKALKNFLRAMGDGTAGAAPTRDDAQLAVAVLLVKAAALDGAFDDAERRAIEALLAERFALSDAAAAALVGEARRLADDSVELYGFTKAIREAFDEEARIGLMEMLWEVVYADGVLHEFEANLMRRVAGLVYVADRESGEARKRVIRKLGLAEA